MSVTAPHRGAVERDASRTKLAHSIGSPCPEPVELSPDEQAVYDAVRAAGGYISPRRLHALYLRMTASADADWDFGAHVLTYLGRHGSRPVDLATGEHATHRIDRQRSRA